MFKLAGELQKAILRRATNKETENPEITIITWQIELYLHNSAFLHDEKQIWDVELKYHPAKTFCSCEVSFQQTCLCYASQCHIW